MMCAWIQQLAFINYSETGILPGNKNTPLSKTPFLCSTVPFVQHLVPYHQLLIWISTLM